MIRKTVTVGTTTIPYYVHGLDPKLLLHAGIHGDEKETAQVLEGYVYHNLQRLPDFVFVPQVSPSACMQETRTNVFGNDLNRQFRKGTTDEEALANMEIIRGFHFDLLVSFHEDVKYSQFYIYDSVDRSGDETWLQLKDTVENLGVSLLTGYDDPTDPVLNYFFEQGYCYCPKSEDSAIDGTFEDWIISEGVAKEWIMPEIPSTIKRRVKEALVTAVMEQMVLPIAEKRVVTEKTEQSVSSDLGFVNV